MKERDDLEKIRRLEKNLGRKLEQLDVDEVMGTIENGYSLDAGGRVAELNLDNQKDVDLSLLRELPFLSALSLDGCSLVDVSPLGALTSLTSLYLTSNQVVDVSPLGTLTQLKFLELSENNIKILPQWVTHIKGEIKWESSDLLDKHGLFLEGNPLETPPVEVVKEGKAAIQNYFQELEKDSIRFLHAKVLLVGQGDVGKTTLMKKILDPDHTIEPGKENTTEGIDIQPWSLQCTLDDGSSEDITVNFWDFGGQEIYHSTHQFFLTKRSLYLLVWDARKEEDPRAFDYWLEIVRLLGKESPVIMVMNKSDQRVANIDEKTIEEKFPNIENFHKISCVKGDGLPPLIWQFRETLGRLPHLADTLPGAWLKIREALQQDTRDHITLEDYYRVCQTFGLGPQRADFLSGYLHDLGVILHFKTDKELQNTVILNPQWATEAVYKLIDTPEIIRNKGCFIYDSLKTYWNPHTYPPSLHPQLVRLMERFELCFNLTHTDEYFVPELLPHEQPEFDTQKYRGTNTLRIEYRYGFMPGGIISRFIARLSYLVNQRRFWKNGVELCFENTTALVQGQPMNNRVRVEVTGPCKGKLLGIVQANLEHIHRTLNMEKKSHYKQMIPCTCSPCNGAASPHFYNYEVLTRHLAKNNTQVLCDESSETVNIEALLNGYTPPPPEKNLPDSLLKAAMHLTGLTKTIKEDEDSRTGFLRLMLEVAGFDALEQARWGQSKTGKSPGRVDLLVTHRDTGHKSACEAFNLSYKDTGVIDDHLRRVFLYDPLGSEENFILVYASAKNFNALWQRYLAYLPERDDLYPRKSGPSEIDTPWAEIKRAVTIHHRENRETTLHHIFINMNPKS